MGALPACAVCPARSTSRTVRRAERRIRENNSGRAPIARPGGAAPRHRASRVRRRRQGSATTAFSAETKAVIHLSTARFGRLGSKHKLLKDIPKAYANCGRGAIIQCDRCDFGHPCLSLRAFVGKPAAAELQNLKSFPTRKTGSQSL